jgi:putative chitinase
MKDRSIFFSEIKPILFRKAFTQEQVDGINAILDIWNITYPASDTRFVAYTLGTTYHETAQQMKPINEFGKGAGRPYGKPAGLYDRVYYGRGFVQLTWDYNYKSATKHLRDMNALSLTDDLYKNPELALRLDIAAKILVVGSMQGWFTGKKLPDFFTAKKSDWFKARTIINGEDRAKLISGYALTFYNALKKGHENESGTV